MYAILAYDIINFVAKPDYHSKPGSCLTQLLIAASTIKHYFLLTIIVITNKTLLLFIIYKI